MAKRANGEGTIRKRVSGKKGNIRWEGRYYDPYLKKQKSVYGDTKEEVRKMLSQIAVKKDTGNFVSQNNITLDEWRETYLSLYVEGVLKPQTISVKQQMYTKHIQPMLGSKRVQNITDMDVKTLLNRLQTLHYATNTISNIRGELSTMLKRAVEHKLISNNPVNNVKVNGTDSKERRELTDYELKWFFRGLKEKRPQDLLFFMMLVTTGARCGEIIGLQWCNLSDNYSSMSINKTYIQYSSEQGLVKGFSKPKTKTSVRTLPIIPRVSEELRKKYEENKEIMVALNQTISDDDFIFIDFKLNELHNHAYYWNAIKNVLDYLKRCYNIEIEMFSPHYFRHTFASRALRSNVSLETLKRLLGHNSYKMIEQVYAHVSQSDKVNAVMAMFSEANN